jgi:hypothetical protein
MRKLVLSRFVAGTIAVGSLLVFGTLDMAARREHSMADRGAMVMGFDQSKTTHHFHLYKDGGSIEVTVNDPKDDANRDAIRSHLPHIAQMFSGGNFDAPMEVHAQHVPGTSELAALKSRLSYKYVETPKGGRVDIVTTDEAAIKAVHDFLKFQIADHKTGDSMAVTKRPADSRP